MKRLVLILGTLVAGVLLFGFLIGGVGWNEVWEPLRALSFLNALIIFLLTGVFILTGALRWHVILKGQGCNIPLFETVKMYLAGFAHWFFAPVFLFGNELFRASSLKEQQCIDLAKGMASVLIDRILEVTSNLFVVLAGGVIFLVMGDHISYSAKMIAAIGSIGGWLFLLALLYIRLFQKKSIVRFFWKGTGGAQEVEEEIFQFFQLRNPAFWQGICLSLGKSIAGIARAWAIIFFFGKGFAILPAITIHAFYYLAILVPIPAALGSHDILQAIAFGALGLGVGTGAAFALVVRAVEMLFAVAGLALLFHFGVRLLGKLMLQKGNKVIKALGHEL